MLVDRPGFEPGASALPRRRSYQAELPAHLNAVITFQSGFINFAVERFLQISIEKLIWCSVNAETVTDMNPVGEALRIKDQIITWRRDFHMYPEPKYEEERTSKVVEEHLREWGYRVKRVGTGIIADIGGERKR